MVFKMKGYSYPGTSPLQKDVKMYNGNGEQVIIDDSNLSDTYRDADGNQARDNKKTKDVLYTKPPRFNQSEEGPLLPSDRPIENKLPLA